MNDREKFEEFAKGEGYNLTTHGEDYWYPATVTAWKLWQAALSSRDSTPTEGVGATLVKEWLDEVGRHTDTVYDDLPGLAQRIDRALAAPRTDGEALFLKWLHRAADTLARNQDDERVVFLLDFDRAFPDAKEPQS